MKVDSEAGKEESKNEPMPEQNLSHQLIEQKKDKFGGGGVYTNEEKTVEQYFGYYAKLQNQ